MGNVRDSHRNLDVKLLLTNQTWSPLIPECRGVCCGEAALPIGDMCALVCCCSQLGSSLAWVTFFASVSTGVDDSCFRVYFDKYSKTCTTVCVDLLCVFYISLFRMR